MIGTATAPASSANLGPGFDCLALALELRCTAEVETSDRWMLEEGGITRLPGPDELVVRAAVAVGEGPMRLRIDNRIPRARGLGSSAAVATAVAAATARAAGREPDPRDLYELVADLEGHTDNAAATVFGGLVATSGRKFHHLELSEGLQPIVAVPAHPLSTAEARRALPAAVPLEAAARTVARSIFLVEGLRTGDPALFAAASGDELHEAPRALLSPLTGELVDVAREAGALHASWSGAGPSVLAFATEAAIGDVEAALTEAVGGGEVLRLQVARTGVV